MPVKFDTTSSKLLLREAIDRVCQAADDPQLPLDDLAQGVVALLTPTPSPELFSDAAKG
ncbi:hypothetical protein KBZ18_14590 [Synechococcus sp. Cruz-9H2]|uniref:hypothetical protein n=1 Tax=unclassified Synechococcus TaxID=2626047 RepID=UPI0020CC9276|nr:MULTISPECIES: hypothetical protein [unclassified Synechococcus]MCP9820710.1 hypothetical protein [Synechococcus sp. Cruz-9H2]MCP9844904.1 hypothetical protein [Synechococcus sp. Edmonson 11F2]MCP9864351.1 hypothetical protein [Synechococcus sp. Cruz-7E5]